MSPKGVHLQQLPGDGVAAGGSEEALEEDSPYGSLGRAGTVLGRAGSHESSDLRTTELPVEAP